MHPDNQIQSSKNHSNVWKSPACQRTHAGKLAVNQAACEFMSMSPCCFCCRCRKCIGQHQQQCAQLHHEDLNNQGQNELTTTLFGHRHKHKHRHASTFGRRRIRNGETTITYANDISSHSVLSTDPSDPRRRVLVSILLQGRSNYHVGTYAHMRGQGEAGFPPNMIDDAVRIPRGMQRSNEAARMSVLFEHRRRSWMEAYGVKLLRVTDDYYDLCLRHFCRYEKQSPEHARAQIQQIERDLHRIGDWYVQRVERSSLRDLCKALSAHDQVTGYAQGINLLGAKALCMLGGDTRCAFFTLIYVCTFGYVSSFNRVGKSFSDTPLMHDVLLIEELLSRCPKVLSNGTTSNLFGVTKQVGLDRNMYATVPLLMLLVQDGCGYALSVHESDRIWDYMVEASHHFVVLCCIVALVYVHADELIKFEDPGEALELLLHGSMSTNSSSGNKESNGSFEGDASGAIAGAGDGLLVFALVGRIMRRVEKQRLEHLSRHRMVLNMERVRIVNQAATFRRQEEAEVVDVVINIDIIAND